MKSFFIVIYITLVLTATVRSVTNILLYDLRPSIKLSTDDIYEYAHLLSAFSGLVNRNALRLFTIYSDSDLR